MRWTGARRGVTTDEAGSGEPCGEMSTRRPVEGIAQVSIMLMIELTARRGQLGE
jgi:hypothetical protein